MKTIDRSPVGDLVAQTVYWMNPEFFVPFLGYWEVIVGLSLLTGVALRLILVLFWLQVAGTFLVLALRPALAFQGGNPLLLTTVGEFVVKNSVLIAAGLVIGSTLRKGGEVTALGCLQARLASRLRTAPPSGNKRQYHASLCANLDAIRAAVRAAAENHVL